MRGGGLRREGVWSEEGVWCEGWSVKRCADGARKRR